MELFPTDPALSNTILCLGNEEQEDPKQVMASFFEGFDLDQVRDQLNHLAETALTTQNDYYQQPEQREGLVYFCKELEKVVEAAWLVKAY